TGVGYCNITKCCTEVCPEHIQITDNGIIPLKERVADVYFDPIMWVGRKLTRSNDGKVPAARLAKAEPSSASVVVDAEEGPPARQWLPIPKDDIEYDSENPYRARAVPREKEPVSD